MKGVEQVANKGPFTQDDTSVVPPLMGATVSPRKRPKLGWPSARDGQGTMNPLSLSKISPYQVDHHEGGLSFVSDAIGTGYQTTKHEQRPAHT